MERTHGRSGSIAVEADIEAIILEYVSHYDSVSQLTLNKIHRYNSQRQPPPQELLKR